MKSFYKYQSKLSYTNPKKNPLTGKLLYGGWVSNFSTYNLNKGPQSKINLNLHTEKDLFLLFVLASCWSRTGKFEYSAYFAAYLKDNNLNNPSYWNKLSNFNKEKSNIKLTRLFIKNNYYQFSKRCPVSINKNFIDSAYGIAKNWKDIKAELVKASKSKNPKNGWKDFMIYINSLEGLAGGCGFNSDGTIRRSRGKNGITLNSKMVIKIPLILREMRVAGIFSNIPGEYCCVPDIRVCDTVKRMFDSTDITLGSHSTISTLIASSQKIYSKFGDWYDIPLFAYEDIKIWDPSLP